MCGCGATAPSLAERRHARAEGRSTIATSASPASRSPIVPRREPSPTPRPESKDWHAPLDDAIRIALERPNVVRVLTGTTATASGQTIYDAAITDTTIDQRKARFDPVLKHDNLWSLNNTPFALPDFTNPFQTVLSSTPTTAYLSTLGVTKTNVLGGELGLTWIENPTRFAGSSSRLTPCFPTSFPLNPQNTNSLELRYTQPLLQGAELPGQHRRPIVMATGSTPRCRSFHTRTACRNWSAASIEAYWNLVQARHRRLGPQDPGAVVQGILSARAGPTQRPASPTSRTSPRPSNVHAVQGETLIAAQAAAH